MTKNNFTNSTDDATTASFLAPWLSVRNSLRAVEFYKSALGAVETYRLETPDGGLVVKLSVNGAEFWLSGESTDNSNLSPESIGGNSIRMILTVPDPDALFDQALRAGALQIFPVGEDHGWRLGRLVDPFGLHWEIGRPLKADEGSDE
jgi:PhnB protein